MNLHTATRYTIFGLWLSLLGGCGSSKDQLPDLASIQNVAVMKTTFYEFLVPIVHAENTAILEHRAQVQGWVEAKDDLSWWQRFRFSRLAHEYEIDEPLADIENTLKQLQLRVNIIPVDLALAQAAKESGWGRSRFAVDHNNLFGQWCYQPGCGVVPKRRPSGATHEVAEFTGVSESVQRYMNNLNTHPRYQEFRQLRAARGRNNLPLSGKSLVPGLLGYSQRGQIYLDELQLMMRANKHLLNPPPNA